MYYTKEDIAKLLTLSIESVALALGLFVKRHCCPCPLHEDFCPSMYFYANTNRFFCFSCRRSGNVIDLVKIVLGVGFTDACDWLVSFSKDASQGQEDWYVDPNACRVNATSPRDPFNPSRYLRYFEHPYLNKPACDFLFEQRKLHPSVIEHCRLTSWKQWLQIPYFDINGNLIGVQWRNLGSSGPRFKFPQGSQCHIYNLNILNTLSPGEELYLSEGCSDCWALISSGHKAIAIPSATLLNLNETGILKGFNLHMYPDQDTPGEALYNQLSKVLTVTRHQLPVGCKDYSELWCKSNAMPSLLEHC